MSVTCRSRLSPSGSRLHRGGEIKGKAASERTSVGSELDRKYDAVLAEKIGEGGPFRIERDALGRAFVGNFPGTLPSFFQTFCALNAATEAVVAGDERLTFAELDARSTQLARVLAGSWGVRKGDRVAIAMRNCPAW